jgi:Uncharacterized conserved protein
MGGNYVECRDKNFTADIELADSFLKRLKGLMFRKEMPKGKALLLEHCNSVHCCFMKFTIDVLYLDKNYVILYKETLKPWSIGKITAGTKSVLELSEGQAEFLEKGDKLDIFIQK